MKTQMATYNHSMNFVVNLVMICYAIMQTNSNISPKLYETPNSLRISVKASRMSIIPCAGITTCCRSAEGGGIVIATCIKQQQETWNLQTDCTITASVSYCTTAVEKFSTTSKFNQDCQKCHYLIGYISTWVTMLRKCIISLQCFDAVFTIYLPGFTFLAPAHLGSPGQIPEEQ